MILSIKRSKVPLQLTIFYYCMECFSIMFSIISYIVTGNNVGDSLGIIIYDNIMMALKSVNTDSKPVYKTMS